MYLKKNVIELKKKAAACRQRDRGTTALKLYLVTQVDAQWLLWNRTLFAQTLRTTVTIL